MGPETIQILNDTAASGSAGTVWAPVGGSEVERMIERLPVQARERVREEAFQVLGRCLPPGEGRGRRAGLVVGQIQSGKTASFTAVAALARDNRIPLIILIAGTKSNLLEQSRKRLAQDLGLGEGDAHFRWAQFPSPTPGGQTTQHLAARLRESLDSSGDDDHVPVLITVMKNATHMKRLVQVLNDISTDVDLERVTALVIDDEVDQATPNLNWKKNSESATYRNLREIRDALPRHTLLEYTATPQALLLVSLADEISPDFTYVLVPGDGYTGGRFFFQEHRDDFVRIIPQDDLSALDPAHPTPPLSLYTALATFLIGVAVGYMRHKSGDPPQRSMLIHPSQATAPQAQFAGWISQARDQWGAILDGDRDADWSDLIETYFRPAYSHLAKTVVDIPPESEVIDKLAKAIRLTRVEEINTKPGSTTSINWSQAYSWVLIGGAMMDRGFTVEGLTVTYMPRPVGVGNADTVQQRARFFGYKLGYAGFCRAWLSTQVADVFDAYVEHEEKMRLELDAQAASGHSLKQWRRRLLLDKSLRPTRKAVISMLYSHHSWSDAWFEQRHVPLPRSSDDNSDIGLTNARVIKEFFKDKDWSLFEAASGLTSMQKHDSTRAPLREVLESVLAEFIMVEEDASEFSALMIGIEELNDRSPDATVLTLNMSQGKTRKRSLDDDTTRLVSLFQGRSRDRRYPGDRNIHDHESLTLQVHWIEPSTHDGTDEGGDPVRSVVPVLAIYVPSAIGFGALIGQ